MRYFNLSACIKKKSIKHEALGSKAYLSLEEVEMLVRQPAGGISSAQLHEAAGRVVASAGILKQFLFHTDTNQTCSWDKTHFSPQSDTNLVSTLEKKKKKILHLLKGQYALMNIIM